MSEKAEKALRFYLLAAQLKDRIRSGWDESSINAKEIAKVIEQAGASAITIHPRTRKQGYSGNADWKIINPDIPNAYKLESFIFDFFEDLEDMQILRVDRDEEYAPIKNATGIDSPQTAKEKYMKFHKK